VSLLVGCRDLGAHIDGFSAVVAHTLVAGASKVCHVYSFIRNGYTGAVLR